ALTRLDAAGFQKAFSDILSELADEIPEKYLEFHEAYYHSIFYMVAKIAGQKVTLEVSVAEGRFDAYYQAPDGTRFVIEFKYCPWQEKDDDTKITYSDAQLKKLSEDMEKKADEATRQIETRNYAQPYRKPGQTIYKVALVVGGRTRVLAVFKRDEDV
ncbi:MAG: PD-(D/E)XK nuclease domain-containing protein, partial [Deltaproteobacteria bacterium]|nr:PD-(D/E)XK nuclease domain-containing protein [Deltaproteobacteria bacterium]